jgi:hypothetical protein
MLKYIGYNNKLRKIKDKEIKNVLTDGTSLQGNIHCTYSQLVQEFGEPDRKISGDNKMDCEWIILTPEGVATIYNYKDGKAYLGEKGLDKEDITDWHVGGRNMRVLMVIEEYLELI